MDLKLTSHVAVITGGDSGIGRAIAVLFAKEGADIAIIYLSEHSDAKEQGKQEGVAAHWDPLGRERPCLACRYSRTLL